MTTTRILPGDVRERLRDLDDASVQCCVTSPPYWGLRDYGCDGQIGLEDSPDAWVAGMVAVFAEVWRVLRDDGTLWLNLGDSYASGQGGRQAAEGKMPMISTRTNTAPWNGQRSDTAKVLSARGSGLKPKDLIGQPWRVASALQAAGWYLRSAIVWAKGLSFCPSYSGSVMPESVGGTRWERCRVKVGKRPEPTSGTYGAEFGHGLSRQAGYREEGGISAKWADCPGCARCEANDGYVLRRGAGRPTSAYEMVFLLTKSPTYYYDAEAVREKTSDNTNPRRNDGETVAPVGADRFDNRPGTWNRPGGKAGVLPTRNIRNVWVINPEPMAEAHFATFPQALVEPMILAGTSERGCCPECGAPWARVVERRADPPADVYTDCHAEDLDHVGSGSDPSGSNGRRGHGQKLADWLAANPPETSGWRPSCKHPGEPVPCTVLDPFGGSGTVAMVAGKLHRDSVLAELNPEYVEIATRRLAKLGSMYHTTTVVDRPRVNG